LKETKRNFAHISSDASFFVSHRSLTAAFRIGGATNIGNDYEFYQANTLGGTTNLRGFDRSRFAGKTSVYQNTELRYKFQSVNGYFLRGNWGLLAFFDNGRVWIPDESSNTWHYGYGGGIWFLPYNKIAFTASYGISKEQNSLLIKAGFLF
jgi:outer membrane translocation and assembly module TamA